MTGCAILLKLLKRVQAQNIIVILNSMLENVFFYLKAVIKLPKKATPIDFAYAVHTKIGNSATGCSINGSHATLQTILKNGDLVNIETSKNSSPSLHWLSSSATGKARSAIRRYWQDKSTENLKVAEKITQVQLKLIYLINQVF